MVGINLATQLVALRMWSNEISTRMLGSTGTSKPKPTQSCGKSSLLPAILARAQTCELAETLANGSIKITERTLVLMRAEVANRINKLTE